jgi:hypothetical protein
MRKQKLNYGEGSIIVYQAFGGARRRVLVEEREDDVKNGRPGFSGVLITENGKNPSESDDGVWGYDDQIIQVVQR